MNPLRRKICAGDHLLRDARPLPRHRKVIATGALFVKGLDVIRRIGLQGDRHRPLRAVFAPIARTSPVVQIHDQRLLRGVATGAQIQLRRVVCRHPESIVTTYGWTEVAVHALAVIVADVRARLKRRDHAHTGRIIRVIHVARQ